MFNHIEEFVSKLAFNFFQTAVAIACKNSLGNDTECNIYARDGECQINPDWMNIYCEKVCGICSSPTTSPTVTVPTGTIGHLLTLWFSSEELYSVL